MKTPLLYGAVLAIIGALLTFGLFFAGFHDTPEKLKAAGWIGLAVGLPAAIICYALAMRARRTEFPATRPWGYGSAVATGVLTALWSTVFNAVFTYIYLAFINPQMQDVALQAQQAAMEKRGMSPAQIDAAMTMVRRFSGAGISTVFNSLGGFAIAVLLVLVVAIFFRRALASAEGTLPESSATPPPVV